MVDQDRERMVANECKWLYENYAGLSAEVKDEVIALCRRIREED